jgi:small subunit ribosomal protein S9
MEKEIKKKKPVHHNPKKSENKEKKVEKPEAEMDFSAAENLKLGRYFEAIGRRKTAVARVRIFAQGEKDFLVNGKPYKKYFSTIDLQQTADNALSKMKCLDRFKVVAQVKGGGLNAQAEAVRHGTARALVDFNADFRKRLRRVGYLTRDPRKRERKKFGLKRARRAPQWNKR